MNPQSHRDPVCGMPIDPATAGYSYVHDGAMWYFCADTCRQQFIANPDQYRAQRKVAAQSAPRRKVSWTREVLVSLSVFAAVIVLVIAARGFTKKAVSVESGSKVIGSAAGQHQAMDSGQGGVFAEATHEQETGDLEFTVSLNTHTVDLTSFDPSSQVRLHADRQQYQPQTISSAGERSSHHQNYQLSFPPVRDANVLVVVHDVGGIEERELPFHL